MFTYTFVVQSRPVGTKPPPHKQNQVWYEQYQVFNTERRAGATKTLLLIAIVMMCVRTG